MDSNHVSMIHGMGSEPLCVLLVEDSEHDWLAFRRAFKKSGVSCEIVRYRRAENALERIKADADPFDLVVSDYKLPGMSGLELCKELLKRKVSLPLVLLTGAGDEHLAVEALKAGVDDYVVKDPDQGYLSLLPLVLPDVVCKYDDRLARQRAESALRKRNRELALLNRLGQELTATLDLQQIIRRLLPEVTEIIGAEGASIWLWVEEEEDALVCRAFFQRGQQSSVESSFESAQERRSLTGFRLRPGQCIAGWVVQTGQSTLVPHASDDPRFFAAVDKLTGFQTVSLLAVPLWVRGKVVGVLEIVNKLGDPASLTPEGRFAGEDLIAFDESDLILAETLAASAAIAVDNADLYADAQQEIAERKRMERALRESASRFETSVENMLDCFGIYSAIRDESGRIVDFRIEYVNAAACDSNRMTKDEQIGRGLCQVLPAHRETGLFDAYCRVVDTGKPFVKEALTYDDVYGEQRSSRAFDIRAAKLGDGFVASWRDVTQRKQAEEERETLIAELEAKNTELERFTYTVSHDLKSPLITMRGFLGFLERDALAGDVERLKTDVARISDATDKMQQLLDGLLDLSHVGRVVNPPEEMRFGDLAREAVGLVEGRLKERGVKVEIAPDLPVVYADRLRLRQVLQNLMDNAVKFIGDQPEPRIEIGMRREGEEEVFYVRDNGMGIEPQYQEQVFGLFEKLDSKAEGSGMGLTIVKRIIEVHGGRIWVESEGIGKGSSFCFTLSDYGRTA